MLLLIEALVGQAKALAELGRKSEALTCLTEAHWLQSAQGDRRNGKARKEILQQFSEMAQG